MEILFGKEEVAAKVAAIGVQIGKFYENQPLSLILLTNGAVFFGADLARSIPQSVWIDTLGVGSYVDDRRGELKIYAPCKLTHKERHVLLVDDVLDSGNTLRQCSAYFLRQGALSVRSAVLVRKCTAQQICSADWCCFEAPDRYLVGFGMDSHEEYRNSPFIGAMD